MVGWFDIFCIQIYNLKIYFNPCSLHYLSSPILSISGIKVQGCYSHGGTNPWVRLCQAKEDIELWASLEIEGPTANAWYGRGLYTVPLAPDGWENIDAILDAWQRERNGVKYLRCRMCLRWPGHMMAADGTCNMTVFWAMTLRPKLTFTVQSWLDSRSADARNTTLDWPRTTTTATWCDVTCKTRVKSMCRRLIPQGPNIAFPFW